MSPFLKALPLLAALIAAPTLAQPKDPHAGHHAEGAAPAAAAEPDAKAPDAQDCPMMKGRMTGGQSAGGQLEGDGKAAPDGTAKGSNGMMSGDRMQKCMMMMMTSDKGSGAAAKPAAPNHDHQHQ